MTWKDRSRVLKIYGLEIETRSATFETKFPSWVNQDINRLEHSRLVYTNYQERILGWVALSAVFEKVDI